MEKKQLQDYMRGEETIFMNRFVEPVVQPPHTHGFLELEYVISGEGIHQVGDAEIPVSSGYAFFTNFGTPHCFLSADENNPITLYNCVFTPESLKGAGWIFGNLRRWRMTCFIKSFFRRSLKTRPFFRYLTAI